jgi:hypothetical protein
MPLEDYLPSCEEMGHPRAKAYIVYHHMNGSFDSDCYCRNCEKPFTRPATQEEIKEFERVQSIPLTEHKH